MAEIVLVCGGRDYHDYKRVFTVMDGMEIDCIVHGGESGAECLAGQWAENNRKPVIVFNSHSDYGSNETDGIRNSQMLKYIKVTRVVEFPGGRGSAHMVKLAREAGIPVTHVEG